MKALDNFKPALQAAAAFAVLILSLSLAANRDREAEETEATDHQIKLDHTLGLIGRGEFDYPQLAKQD